MEKITSLLSISCGKVVIFLMVMQKLHGILYVCLGRKGLWVLKILNYGTKQQWLKHLWSICNPANSI